MYKDVEVFFGVLWYNLYILGCRACYYAWEITGGRHFFINVIVNYFPLRLLKVTSLI